MSTATACKRTPQQRPQGDEGYLLIGLVVACFLLLLVLGVAAPRVAKQLERDREVESEHRAEEYVRAIQLYYRKNNSFPTSIDQLLGGGSSGVSSAAKVKYLRQQYKDPLTRDDYRLIHLGEAKTEVKGFFGEPLQGASASGGLGTPASGLSSAAGSTFTGSQAGTTPGSSSAGSGFSLGTSSFGSGTASSTTGSGTGSNSTNASGTLSGTSATNFQGSKGAIVGVGSNAKGHGLVEWNGSENIEDWEFLYDPRVELLKAKVNILGGGPSTVGSGTLGNGFSNMGSQGTSSNSTSAGGTSSSGAANDPTPTSASPAAGGTGTPPATPQGSGTTQ